MMALSGYYFIVSKGASVHLSLCIQQTWSLWVKGILYLSLLRLNQATRYSVKTKWWT